MVVGLGNPGKQYEGTPHNVGFMTLDRLGERLSVTLRRRLRFRVQTGRAQVAGESVLLVKPQTFMNLSGTAVASMARYRKIPLAEIVVVMDDADLDLGRIRVRSQGGSGGHRGLASVVEHLGSGEFSRVRLGVGRGEGRKGLVDHVLSAFSGEEQATVDGMVGVAADAVLCVLMEGVDAAMNRFNGSGPGDRDDDGITSENR